MIILKLIKVAGFCLFLSSPYLQVEKYKMVEDTPFLKEVKYLKEMAQEFKKNYILKTKDLKYIVKYNQDRIFIEKRGKKRDEIFIFKKGKNGKFNLDIYKVKYNFGTKNECILVYQKI